MDKVNLIYGAGDVLHTHLNINPFTEEESENIIRDDIFKLIWLKFVSLLRIIKLILPRPIY